MKASGLWVALLGLAAAGPARAASYAFDGTIDRTDPEDWGGSVTMDFLKLEVGTSGTLTVTGMGGTLVDFSFGLYTPYSRDGSLALRFYEMTVTPLAGGWTQLQGGVTAGTYYLYLGSGTDEWEGRDGLETVGYADGGPGEGAGSYHVDIEGDFSVTAVIQGQLAQVPEAGAAALAAVAAGAACVFHRRRRL